MGSGSAKPSPAKPSTDHQGHIAISMRRSGVKVIPGDELGPEENIDPDFIKRHRQAEVKAKLLAVAAFTKHIKARPARDELTAFVAASRSNKAECWKVMQQEVGQEDKFRIRPHSGIGRMDVMVANATKVPQPAPLFLHENEGVCHLCRQMATYDGYPCRVCTRVYHLNCLKEHGVITGPAPLAHVAKMAVSNTGWSCPQCEDISQVLKEQEIQGIIEEFEKYSLNSTMGDAHISWEQYLNYHREEQAKMEDPWTEADEQRIRLKFRLSDLNGDGVISWQEFLCHESEKRLMQRDKKELVDILTKKEIAGAQMMFNNFDKDRDGVIKESDIKQAYHSWYGQFEKLNDNSCSNGNSHEPTTPTSPGVMESPALKLHVENQARLVMEDSNTGLGLMTWTDFLENQAAYILCSRPNRNNASTHT